MPEGHPSAEDLLSKKVGGFSIDTCVFEAHGFRLDKGELGVLHLQLPPWLTLYVPAVIWREVLAHQLRNTTDALNQTRTAIQNLERHTGVDVAAVEKSIVDLKLDDPKALPFELRLSNFLKRFDGEFLPLEGEGMLKVAFDRYFDIKPPFENKKDKKHEFPDVVSLLALEAVAKSRNTMLVLVSTDEGWKQFSKESQSLYCVTSLEQLTALYVSASPAAEAIEQKIIEALKSANSELSKRLETVLEHEIQDLSWYAEAYTGVCAGIDAEIDSIALKSFGPDLDTLRLWISEQDSAICVAELDLSVTCEFHVSADFWHYDSVDKDRLPMGTGTKRIEKTVTVPVFLTFSGDLAGDVPDDWDIAIESSEKEFSIDAGEMEPDWMREPQE